MKLYVASRYGRREWIKWEVLPLLLADGHQVTSRWLDRDTRPPTQTEALRDLEDVDESEGLLAILDPIDSRNAGGGRFFEMGYAYRAATKRIVVWGEHEIVFCLLPRIEVYSTLDLARAALMDDKGVER